MAIYRTPYALHTQLARIREMMTSLISSELMVKARLESQEKHIQQDNYHHAYEIIWGWEQLLKEINSLPDTCIDKSIHIEKAKTCFKRAIKLLKQCEVQYLGDREEYPTGLIGVLSGGAGSSNSELSSPSQTFDQKHDGTVH